MLNDLQRIAIEKFAQNIYENNGNVQEAKFFLTHKQSLGIKAIDFKEDGQIVIITNDDRIEFLFYSNAINDLQNKKSK